MQMGSRWAALENGQKYGAAWYPQQREWLPCMFIITIRTVSWWLLSRMASRQVRNGNVQKLEQTGGRMLISMMQNGPQLSEGLIILLEFILTLSGAVLHSYGPRLMDLEEAAGFFGERLVSISLRKYSAVSYLVNLWVFCFIYHWVRPPSISECGCQYHPCNVSGNTFTCPCPRGYEHRDLYNCRGEVTQSDNLCQVWCLMIRRKPTKTIHCSITYTFNAVIVRISCDIRNVILHAS